MIYHIVKAVYIVRQTSPTLCKAVLSTVLLQIFEYLSYPAYREYLERKNETDRISVTTESIIAHFSAITLSRVSDWIEENPRLKV